VADVLEDVQSAIGLWFNGAITQPAAVQDWSHQSSTDPLGGAVNWTNQIIGFLINNVVGAATLIGIDTDTCISYWHLTGVSIKATLATYDFVSCVVGTRPFAFSNNTITKPTFSTVNIDIKDGHSSTAPIDSHEVIPHGGAPVVAAVHTRDDVSNVYWKAFAAGEASAVTVAAARTACGTGTYNLCGEAVEEIDVDVFVE